MAWCPPALTGALHFGCGLEELLAPLGAATVLVLSPSGCQRRDMWTKKAPRRGVTRAEASVGSQWTLEANVPRDLPPTLPPGLFWSLTVSAEGSPTVG